MNKKVISYIGVDIAKSKFDLCHFDSNFSKSVYATLSNDELGFDEFYSFIKSVNEIENVRVGFEATSTYMLQLQKYLDSKSIKYTVINPKKLHHFIKYSFTENKTDKLDSYYISFYISKLKDESFNSSYNQNRILYKTYNSYLSLIIKTETHLKGLNDSILSDDYTSLSLQKEVMSLKNSLKKTKENTMEELLYVVKFAMPEYDFIKNDLIGVGDKTLLAVLPIIYDISHIYTVKQIQSFIGLNPVYKDSGNKFTRQRISKNGNNEARKMLYMSALASVRLNGDTKEKYLRLVASGKPKKVALIAISCHILRAIYNRLNYYKGLSLYDK